MISIYPQLPKNFILGLALRRISSQQNHIGFVFFDSNNQLKICHLCWHKEMRLEDFNDNRYGISDILINSYNLTHLAATLESIGSKNQSSIPYSFSSPVVVFDGSHVYVGHGKGEGLTCATFVMSVLEYNAFKIVDKSTWQTTLSDRNWCSEIISNLTRSGITDQQHISTMRAAISKVTRFKPEQIYGCGIVEKKRWPIIFNEAEVIADAVIEIMSSKGL